jgi:hypothetical protein
MVISAGYIGVCHFTLDIQILAYLTTIRAPEEETTRTRSSTVFGQFGALFGPCARLLRLQVLAVPRDSLRQTFARRCSRFIAQDAARLGYIGVRPGLVASAARLARDSYGLAD